METKAEKIYIERGHLVKSEPEGEHRVEAMRKLEQDKVKRKKKLSRPKL